MSLLICLTWLTTWTQGKNLWIWFKSSATSSSTNTLSTSAGEPLCTQTAWTDEPPSTRTAPTTTSPRSPLAARTRCTTWSRGRSTRALRGRPCPTLACSIGLKVMDWELMCFPNLSIVLLKPGQADAADEGDYLIFLTQGLYDTFLSQKNYDHALFDSFWGSAGFIDSPTTYATLGFRKFGSTE